MPREGDVLVGSMMRRRVDDAVGAPLQLGEGARDALNRFTRDSYTLLVPLPTTTVSET